mmetsp:Transcript_13999/g.16215  ORF Transcript_13999/g.16215 Transcript_13999/m.16215 type:complete len:218 (-) Transcript_13999:319-972(-)
MTAFMTPIPWPRKIPRIPNSALSRPTSLTASMTEIDLPEILLVCMITSNRDKGLVTTTYIGETIAEAINPVSVLPILALFPSSSWMYFCRRGWPTKPSKALAREWPINGIVPRNSGLNCFAADSLRISIIGLVVPVCLKNALCCFSIIRIGLMNGADKIDAPVAAYTPGFSPVPNKKENPNKIPNFGIRLKPTPARRGPIPLILAPTRLARNTALAS